MRYSTLFLLPLAATLHAASPVDTAINTAQGVSTRGRITAYGRTLVQGETETAPELYPGESRDIGPQFLVMPVVKKVYFESGADVQYYYSSNALLTEKGNTDTGILLSTAYFGLAPTPIDIWGGKLAWRAGYRHQIYNYGLDNTANQLNNIDFHVGTVYLTGRFTFWENWTVSLGIDYNRYMSVESNNNEFYTEAVPQWGIEKYIEINDRNYITLGYFGGCHFTYTDPLPISNINDRLDTTFLITTVHQLTDKLILQPFYRFQQTHYWQNSDRNDAFNTVGVALAYLINDWASVRVFTNYEMRDSNDQSIPDYHKFDTGGGVSVSVKF
jgi:hypothetical protein